MRSKILLSAVTLSFLTQVASAACAENSVSRAARRLNLSGFVLLQAIDNEDGKTKEYIFSEAGTLQKESEEFNAFSQLFLVGKDRELLSKVFYIESPTSVIALVRNTQTCEVSLAETDADGKEKKLTKILNVNSSSIQYHYDEVTKGKLSKVFVK